MGRVFSVLLAVVFSSTAAAGEFSGHENCQGEQQGELTNSLNFQTAESALSVTLGRGVRLELRGHNHGSTRLASWVLDGVLNGRSTRARNLALQAFRAENQETLRQATVNVAWLRRALQEKRISVVAVEASPPELENNLAAIRDAKTGMERKLVSNGVESQEQATIVTDLLLAQFGPVLFLSVTEPELFEGVDIAAAEDAKVKEDFLRAYRELMAEYNRSLLVFRMRQDVRAEAIFKSVLTDVYMQRDLNRETVMRAFQDALPEKWKAEKQAWEPVVDLSVAVVRASEARERAILSNLRSKNKNGALFIGSDHVKGFLNLITGECTITYPIRSDR